MFESIFNISIAAFIAGFIFAMPIAGPMSILIVSNVLNGRRRFSTLAAAGAAASDSIYVFIAVYGLSRFYSFYKPAIPYLFIVGALFFIFLSQKIYRTRIDLGDIGEKKANENMRDQNGFYTGFMINLLNPTLFLSGLISAFFVISFVASLGLNTGGLNLRMDTNVKVISSIEGARLMDSASMPMEALKKLQDSTKILHRFKQAEGSYPSYFHAIISLCYALFISMGSFIWFQILGWWLTRYRRKINPGILTGLIKGFGIILFVLGLYFGYLGVRHFF